MEFLVQRGGDRGSAQARRAAVSKGVRQKKTCRRFGAELKAAGAHAGKRDGRPGSRLFEADLDMRRMTAPAVARAASGKLRERDEYCLS